MNSMVSVLHRLHVELYLELCKRHPDYREAPARPQRSVRKVPEAAPMKIQAPIGAFVTF